MQENNKPEIELRPEISRRFGQMYDGTRDTWDVLGYDKALTAEDYRAKFKRQDMARRIIELPANDTWQINPEVTGGSGFESDLQQLIDNRKFFHYCKRADIVSGIGEYGVLFIGVADSQPLDTPLEEDSLSGPEDIRFMTPFAQDQVEDWILGKEITEIDETHERYNKPVIYDIDFSDLDSETVEDDIKEVHHSRLIHVAERLVESDLKGTPRLRPVYNRLEDYEKVIGASAEMFWAGADRKFQFNIDTNNVGDISADKLQELDNEVEKLVHDMQHYVKTFNTDMEVFGGDDPDPSGILDEIIKAISGATGIPQRILTGSERGELASSQDRANWYGTIESRQNNFAEPKILRPLIDRLIYAGALSSADYEIEWPELFELTEKEESTVWLNRSKALKNLAPNGSTDMLFNDTQEMLEYMTEGEIPDNPPSMDIPEIDEENPEVQEQWEETNGSE